MGDNHTDPVLRLQSHQSHPPRPAPANKDPRDDAHPERDQTATPHSSDKHSEQRPALATNAPEHQQTHQQENSHQIQDASGVSDPAQSHVSQHSTPTLPPMNYQHPPAVHTPAPVSAPAPVHAQNGHHPQHHQPPPPQHHPHSTPAHNTNGQYPPHGHAPPPNYTYPSEAGMQQPGSGMQSNGYAPHIGYQAPPQLNANQLPGTRHKKEIKRRTKTGCLTCRKRRIKCDEGHPACRNCQKSKRECLGYDPIFKAQTSPQTIQPAPGIFPPPPPHQQQPQQQQVKHEPHMSSEPQRYSNIPQGYMPAASAGYSSTTVMQPPVDFGAQIDPALGPVNPAIAPPPIQTPPLPPPPPHEEYTTSLHPQRNGNFHVASTQLATC